MSRINWHGLECIKVEDMHLDIARGYRQQYRQKSQAPTQMLKVNDVVKDQQLKFM